METSKTAISTKEERVAREIHTLFKSMQRADNQAKLDKTMHGLRMYLSALASVEYISEEKFQRFDSCINGVYSHKKASFKFEKRINSCIDDLFYEDYEPLED